MNDRELLELAAKAAGIRHIEYTNGYDGKDGLVLCNEYGSHTTTWSPLTNDGDALRLAVKLGMDINHYSESRETSACRFDGGIKHRRIEKLNNDPYAATRRAIVLAAAEIGREMK